MMWCCYAPSERKQQNGGAEDAMAFGTENPQ